METLASGPRGARIVVDETSLLVDLPDAAPRAIALSDLRALRFTTADAAALELEATSGGVVLSGFAVDPYTIDARIRARSPHTTSPDPLAEIPPDVMWAARGSLRVMIGGLAALLLVGPLALAAVTSPVTLAFSLPIGVLLGLAMVGLAINYRGRLIFDRRGVFFVRGSRASFIAWSEIDRASVEIRGVPVQTVELRSAKHANRARIAVNRVLGLGFPLGAIVRAARASVMQHR